MLWVGENRKIERGRLQLNLASLSIHGSVTCPMKSFQTQTMTVSAVCDNSPAETTTSDLSQLTTVLCISQFQLRPSPPLGNWGAFAHPVSSGGGALTNLAWPGGRAFAYPGATPGVLTHSWFPTRNPNMEDLIAKDQQYRPSWTGQASGGFLDFMHFFIAYQGTT